MLTEYSTYDDIRKFRDKAWAKFYDMADGWLYPKIKRQLLEWHKHSGIVRKGHYKGMFSKFVLDHQVVVYYISPFFDYDGVVSKERYGSTLSTHMETEKRHLFIVFHHKNIHVMTRHFCTRYFERSDFKYCIPIDHCKVARYRRYGEIFEYRVFVNYIMITKRLATDILYFKTFLHRDIITGRNHKELIARAERGVDYDDIYEWK